MNRPAIAIAGTRGGPFSFIDANMIDQSKKIFRIFRILSLRTVDPKSIENVFQKVAVFDNFSQTRHTVRACPSSPGREANAIVKCSFDDESFSDLFFSRPRWSKSLATRRLLGACLLRSTKMTTLGYFRNWRTKGHDTGCGNMSRMGMQNFLSTIFRSSKSTIAKRSERKDFHRLFRRRNFI